MPPRIRDIAAYLGVSPATVSMALNNRPGVNSQTREKVLSAVKDLEYQSVSTKRAPLAECKNIPLVVVKKHGRVVAETAFFAALIEATQIEAKNKGYQLSIHYLDVNWPNCKAELVEISRNADPGVLLLATELTREDLLWLVDDKIPFVVMDNAAAGVSANKVLINNFEGSYKAVKALQNLGHRDIGYLHSKVWINNFTERYSGFCSAMDEAGLPINKDWLIVLDSTHQGAYADLCDYLDKSKTLPTAFFADNDIIASGAMKALKEYHIDIPGRVSIIGFDDMPFCTMLEPMLSTMQVDIRSIGKVAVKLLTQEDGNFQKIEVETKLITRDSVRKI